MKKQKKSKKTPSDRQKERRAKRKLKSKRIEEEQRTNWVLDTLRWVDAEEYRRQNYMNNEANTDSCGGGDMDDDDAHDDDGDDDDDSSDDSSENENDRDGISDTMTYLTSDNNTVAATTTTTNPNAFSIISWNILADQYCNRSSHRELPPKFQRRVFDRKQRRHHVQQTLRRLVRRTTHAKQDRHEGGDATTYKSDINCISPDLLALQEVDPPLGVASCLKEQGYEAIETVATKGGRVGRVDSCGLYYREDVWTYVRHETVLLDDLATNCSSDIVGNKEKIGGGGNDNTIDRSKKASTNMNESLRGLQTSLSRKNVALIVRLHHKPTEREVVVVNAHFFWNPAYEYVKVSFCF